MVSGGDNNVIPFRGLDYRIERGPSVPVPRSVRLRLLLSTSARLGATEPTVVEFVGMMRARGWCIRSAYQRNYILWRNGSVMRMSKLPVVVLPLGPADLSPQQLDCFVLGEMLRALVRVSNDGQFDEDLRLAILKAVGIVMGIKPQEALPKFEAVRAIAETRLLTRPW